MMNGCPSSEKNKVEERGKAKEGGQLGGSKRERDKMEGRERESLICARSW